MRTVDNLIKSGELPAKRFGHSVRVPESAVTTIDQAAQRAATSDGGKS